VREGANDAAAITLGTQATTGNIAERMRITSTGNVGIGTTSPDATLEIEHDDSNTDPAFKVTIVDTDSTADSTPFVVSNIGRVGIGTASPLADMALTLNGDGTSYEGIGWQVAGSLKWRQYCDASSMYMDARANGYDLTIRMQDGSGSLRPAMQLDGTTKGVTIGNDGGSDSGVVNMNKLQVNLDGGDKSDGILIVSNSTDVSANDKIGGIGFDTRDGNVPSSIFEASAYIAAYASETHEDTDKGGYLTFGTAAENEDDDVVSTERMRITDEGYVGIGTTAPTGKLTITDSGHDMIHLNRTVDNEGYGMGIIGRAGNSSSTTAAHEYAAMFFQIEDNTANSEAGGIAFNTSSGGTAADAGGTHAMQITSAGKVGIGTTAPGRALTVRTESADHRIAQINRTASNTAALYLGNDSSNNAWITGNNSHLIFGRDYSGTKTEYMRVENGTGRVGIGTTAPAALLDIMGTSGNQLRLSYNATHYWILERDSNGKFNITNHQNDTDVKAITIDTTEQVGIGTTSPVSRLDLSTGALSFATTNTQLKLSGGSNVDLQLGHWGNAHIIIDSNNSDTSRYFSVRHGNTTAGSATELFKVHENGATTVTGTLDVSGGITGATKEFVIDHPTKPNMKLHHGSLEGPEHGVYIRGKNNSGTIHLPDYWQGLVDEDSITVQLTAIGNPQELYVRGISNGKVRVAAKSRGKHLEYFYFIQAERKDVEKLEVEECRE